MKKTLNVSLVQAVLFWEDTEKNLFHLQQLVNTISETDVILLPEMFNTAFSPKSNYLAETINGKTVSWMREISKQKKCAVTGTLMLEEKGKLYNRLIWVSKKGEISTYDKRHLFSLIKEDKLLTKGKNRLIVEEEGWKICPLICYDLRFPVFSRNNVEYDVLIFLANWPTKRIEAWDVLLKARAIENQCYTIGVNRVGEDGNRVFFNGHSKVIDAFGKELIVASEDKEEVLQISICREDLYLKRRQMNFLQDRDNFTLQ